MSINLLGIINLISKPLLVSIIILPSGARSSKLYILFRFQAKISYRTLKTDQNNHNKIGQYNDDLPPEDGNGASIYCAYQIYFRKWIYVILMK
jgi:hypothetical protein